MVVDLCRMLTCIVDFLFLFIPSKVDVSGSNAEVVRRQISLGSARSMDGVSP